MQTQNNIFAALGLHTAKMLIIKYVTWRFVVALLHCAPYSGNNLCDVCLRHLPSFALFRSPVRFLWGSVTLYPLLFSFCLSAPSHFHFCSSFSHLVDDSLVFESCVFCSMICSAVSLLLPGLSLFFLLLLLHPGSQPNLTYVSASDVLINNCTMLTIMLNSSRPLLVTPRDPFECSHPTSLSRSHFMPSSPWQDFLGQVFCTLGEIVGSPASRLEKPLGWVEISQCSICRVVWQEWQALSVF